MRVHRLDIESVTVESFPVAPLGSPDYFTFVIANAVGSGDECVGIGGDGYETKVGLTCGASCVGLDCPP